MHEESPSSNIGDRPQDPTFTAQDIDHAVGRQDALSPAEDSTRQGTGPGPEPGSEEPGTVHLIVGAVWTRIVLSGEIDASLSAEFSEAMSDAEAAGLPVEVDAHHVTFMDSSGVAFLARLTTRSSHRMRVLRAPATMRFLLDVTRIGELLDVLDEDPGFEEAPVDEFTIERIPRQTRTD